MIKSVYVHTPSYHKKLKGKRKDALGETKGVSPISHEAFAFNFIVLTKCYFSIHIIQNIQNFVLRIKNALELLVVLRVWLNFLKHFKNNRTIVLDESIYDVFDW